MSEDPRKRVREEYESEQISARARSQRARREREHNSRIEKHVEERVIDDEHISVPLLITPTTCSTQVISPTPRINAQRARRERERKLKIESQTEERVTSIRTTTISIPTEMPILSREPDFAPISARTHSQRARRERERNTKKGTDLQEHVMNNPPATDPIQQTKQTRAESQRKRREREKNATLSQKRLRVEYMPASSQVLQHNSTTLDHCPISIQLTRKQLSQRARRERERNFIIQQATESDIQHRVGHSETSSYPPTYIPDKGKRKINEFIPTSMPREIVYYVGSSSTGNNEKEHEVQQIEYIFSNDTPTEYNVNIPNIEDLVSDYEETNIMHKERHSLGEMDIRCQFCGALHWYDEKLVNSPKSKPRFGMCCLQGKIKLPPHLPFPAPLKSLFEGTDRHARLFRQCPRSYNAANAFASLGVKIDDRVMEGVGPCAFTIHGELHHRIGTLLPNADSDPVYSQLYVYDANMALDYRQGRNPHLQKDILQTIQYTLLQTNELCKIYKQAYEILKEYDDGSNTISARLHYKAGTDRFRYNVPTSKEIAIVLPGDGTPIDGMRDIILHLRDRGLQRINECHPLYLPSHYVLFYPHGELGWSPDLTQWDPTHNCPKNNNRLSQLQYHGYQLFERPPEYSPLFSGGNLFEEYLVDAYAAYDQNKLNWVRYNQPLLRSEVAGGLADNVHDGVNPSEMGQRFVLPSSHPGSPRYMYELYQDAMAITRHFKHPDIFLTATANPNWPEIKKRLKPHQTATNRPDLVARVFELKRKAIMKEIVDKKIFGEVAAYVYTIEFQKRGLPHMHALIFLKQPYKISTVEQVDRFISAEIPDPVARPALFQTVMKCMIHGPCGEYNKSLPCMQNPLQKCSSKYPHKYNPQTDMDVDGYPNYMRRDTGRKYKVRRCEVDNRNVVPYNPHLCEMFDCHINVEVCSSVRAVKYITKYIHKGFDRTTMILNGHNDEIQIYIDGRYIGSPEAAWRLFGFAMHEESPNVVRLALHLPGMQHVVYDPEDTKEQILQKMEKQVSTLMAFFKFCAENESARAYTYQEFPEHHVWEKTKRQWKVRQHGFAIGRVYFASPNSGERFYLRLLLTVVKGPTSFDYLQTVKHMDGSKTTYETFKEACVALGLLEDDEEWAQCLEEATVMKTGYQLRRLFCIILLECSPTSPGSLWTKYALKICDDVPHILRTKFAIENPSDDQIVDYGLFLLEEMLQESGKELSDFPRMPRQTSKWQNPSDNTLIWEQLQYQYDENLQHQATNNINRLNEEQLHAYNTITNSTINGKGKLFFLNRAAGTGKTFVYNTIAATCRSHRKIVIMVASSGIAALLLDGGRTAHSALKIPLEIMENSVCSFSKNTPRAALLKEASLIIWDEVPMQHKYCMEAVDRTLQDIRNDSKPFGGITMVPGGDFRQTLPVIPRGVREEIVAASLRRSYLWKHLQVINLVKNMRLDLRDQDNIEFANYLMEVGSNPEESIQLPPGIKRTPNVGELIRSVYPMLNINGTATDTYLTERTILAARNEDVNELNDEMLDMFPGDFEEFLSADKVIEDGADNVENGRRYPTELLNSQNHASMPPFRLKLKKGCPIMLLRNIAPKDGLCNGTRLKVLQSSNRVLEAKILTGSKAGNEVLIPRITISPSTKELPFKMARRQFPVRLAFAMTINKSQGQSVKYVGVDLRVPVFSHGQLYVALSRCTSSKRISVILPPDQTDSTTNVVYPEVLL